MELFSLISKRKKISKQKIRVKQFLKLEANTSFMLCDIVFLSWKILSRLATTLSIRNNTN